MHVHLEGMGLVGSVLACELEAMGIDFTWSDLNRHRTAWKACTGCVFPTGNPLDESARQSWLRGDVAAGTRGWLQGHVEVCPWVFGSKKPPHGGKYGYHQSVFGLNIAEEHSLHLNAQRMVPAVREHFRLRETLQWERGRGPVEADVYIVTHSNTHLLGAEWWGWTVPVRIRTLDVTLPQRAAYYKHLGPVLGPTYAYPIPGTNFWYAGSTLRRSAQEFDVDKEYDKWLVKFLNWTDGAVEVQRAGEGIQGWRPSATSPELSKGVPEQWLHPVPDRENTWAMWPCATDGVRRAPLYAAAFRHFIETGESNG